MEDDNLENISSQYLNNEQIKVYLEACLESLIKQTYDNYEVILVNDGSTDQSLEICKLFEKKCLRL